MSFIFAFSYSLNYHFIYHNNSNNNSNVNEIKFSIILCKFTKFQKLFNLIHKLSNQMATNIMFQNPKHYQPNQFEQLFVK